MGNTNSERERTLAALKGELDRINEIAIGLPDGELSTASYIVGAALEKIRELIPPLDQQVARLLAPAREKLVQLVPQRAGMVRVVSEACGKVRALLDGYPGLPELREALAAMRNVNPAICFSLVWRAGGWQSAVGSSVISVQQQSAILNEFNGICQEIERAVELLEQEQGRSAAA